MAKPVISFYAAYTLITLDQQVWLLERDALVARYSPISGIDLGGEFYPTPPQKFRGQDWPRFCAFVYKKFGVPVPNTHRP